MAVVERPKVVERVKVHPVALFSIVDAYQRRSDVSHRIIGTLLGSCQKGTVEVRAAFPVPHQETEDEVSVDLEFASNMVELHKKVNTKDTIVGWFATGSAITAHSNLIHEYYIRTTVGSTGPIHLTVDTALTDNRMGINAYRRAPMGVPGKTQGSIFFNVPCEVCSYNAGSVAVKEMLAGRKVKDKTLTLGTDLEQVLRSTEKMLEVLERITAYVDDVLAGRITADSSIGRMLFDVVASVPTIDPEQFELMVTSGMEDLLMIVYLANIARAQLSLGEKLTSVL